eukprot:1130692-Pyramimonas_sp.AAC.1
MLLGAGEQTADIHRAEVQDDEEIQIMPTVKLWRAIYATAHNISDANAPKVMKEAGVRQYIWLKRTPTCSMLIGSRF